MCYSSAEAEVGRVIVACVGDASVRERREYHSDPQGCRREAIINRRRRHHPLLYHRHYHHSLF